MKVAIVGAGYAGLSVAWHLLEKNLDVTVFDGGPGASHVSTGLLHVAPGRRLEPIWRAHEGMAATLELLNIASHKRPVYEQNGILRFMGNETFFDAEGITVYSRLYLEGLKSACHKAKFISHWVKSLDELADYDRIILATGAETLDFVKLPLQKTIGQCLICRWKERLPHSLLSLGHITPTEDPDYCQVGSTYEHTEKPDPKKALELLDKAALFYPPAKDFEIVEIRCGVRIAPKGTYKPIVAKINPKTWVFTGLGSRGLIYHALLAKMIEIP